MVVDVRSEALRMREIHDAFRRMVRELRETVREKDAAVWTVKRECAERVRQKEHAHQALLQGLGSLREEVDAERATLQRKLSNLGLAYRERQRFYEDRLRRLPAERPGPGALHAELQAWDASVASICDQVRGLRHGLSKRSLMLHCAVDKHEEAAAEAGEWLLAARMAPAPAPTPEPEPGAESCCPVDPWVSYPEIFETLAGTVEELRVMVRGKDFLIVDMQHECAEILARKGHEYQALLRDFDTVRDEIDAERKDLLRRFDAMDGDFRTQKASYEERLRNALAAQAWQERVLRLDPAEKADTLPRLPLRTGPAARELPELPGRDRRGPSWPARQGAPESRPSKHSRLPTTLNPV